MLDQENKTHVEQSTLNTNNNCKLSSSNPSTFRNNPLNDHDYCSKAKQQIQPQQQPQSPQIHPQQHQRQPPQQTRVRKPRQNTSVTDKSQWITGEEQVDSALSEHIGNGRLKRQRKEVHDPEFSQLSSSEYSSSDAGSDPDSEYDSEEDPNRPWCTCEQPDDGSFMIACEICEYWFHGRCVGMTEALSKRRAKEKKDWFCSICDHALQSGTPRDAIPRRLVKKEKKKAATRVKRRRGRPRKSNVRSPEATTRLSLRSAKRANTSVESNSKFEGKSNARVESFKKFDDQQRLKELIRERKKEFFRKRNMDTQIKVQRIKEIGLGRQSITDSMGHSLDTVASSTNSPNMNNLPINIKSEHKARPKPNIVLQINTKKDGATETGGQRMVTAIVKKRKTSESCDSTANELFTDPIIQQGKKSKSQATRVNTPTPSKPKVSGDTASPNSEARAEISNDQSEQQLVQKIRKRKESNTTNGSSRHVDSLQIVQKIKECLNDRGQILEGLDMKSIDTEKLASDIEEQLNECFKVGSSKYLPKYRSLIFNLRDPKNQALVRNVLTGFISPSRLVRMSPDEMAPNELAKWREMENKHSIELIKRDAELAAQQVIVKKTHKGEEVIAAPEPNEPDDPTAAKEDQELPSTPTKTPVKIDTSKVSASPSINEMSKNGAFAAKNLDFKLQNISEKSSDDPSINLSTSLGELVGIQEQASVATGIDRPSTSDQSTLNSEKTLIKEEESREPKTNQPKRLRISIDTKLDPANLSRLTQPLLKREIPPESVESSPSKMSPNAGSGINDNFDDGNESEELYDPEIPTIPERASIEVVKKNPKNQCWSGSITMSEVGKFNAFARPVSGDLDFMEDEISHTLMVCGRIALDNVTSYIKKIISTQKNQICLVQLYPLEENDRATFDTFFEHLYTRNRYGVINTNGHRTVLKDFYVLPIHEKGNIPEVLRPINGPGLDRKETNCLLGLLVRANRPNSATSSVLSYTPSSIK